MNFPSRLAHKTPSWVADDAIFHIRIRTEPSTPESLTSSNLARKLLDSVRFHVERGRWAAHLFLLMPDHCHSLIWFPPAQQMSAVVGDWKRFHQIHSGIMWQENFFDHRLRTQKSFEEKYMYILNNPVAKGLCESVSDWPWKIDGAI